MWPRVEHFSLSLLGIFTPFPLFFLPPPLYFNRKWLWSGFGIVGLINTVLFSFQFLPSYPPKRRFQPSGMSELDSHFYILLFNADCVCFGLMSESSILFPTNRSWKQMHAKLDLGVGWEDKDHRLESVCFDGWWQSFPIVKTVTWEQFISKGKRKKKVEMDLLHV